MIEIRKLPFRDWCWLQEASVDEDGHFPLHVASKLLGVSIEQVLGWLNSGEIGSLSPFDVELAYLNPPEPGNELPRINPRSGEIEMD